jgi:hypothetical protein
VDIVLFKTLCFIEYYVIINIPSDTMLNTLDFHACFVRMWTST